VTALKTAIEQESLSSTPWWDLLAEADSTPVGTKELVTLVTFVLS